MIVIEVMRTITVRKDETKSAFRALLASFSLSLLSPLPHTFVFAFVLGGEGVEKGNGMERGEGDPLLAPTPGADPTSPSAEPYASDAASHAARAAGEVLDFDDGTGQNQIHFHVMDTDTPRRTMKATGDAARGTCRFFSFFSVCQLAIA
jgi:hypothetical protein